MMKYQYDIKKDAKTERTLITMPSDRSLEGPPLLSLLD